uniref:Uncharacterized protein n=1 Tax=Acanthochromis polyacanthus TaxID=80966 RepID=A0A3Q1FKC8_9TELE
RMSEQELDDIVQITVEDFNQEARTGKIYTTEFDNICNLLVSFTGSVGQRLEEIESKLHSLDATCKALGRKLDSMIPCAKSPIQVPMVAGSPQGATQTWNKVRWLAPNICLLK